MVVTSFFFLIFILLVPPLISPFTFGEEPTNPGESAGVQCMITKGDTPIQIRWVLNSIEIFPNQNGISIIKLSAKTSVLNIISVMENHRGIYECIAENRAGKSKFSAELHVNGILNFGPPFFRN